MPKVDGRSLLRWVTQNHPESAVILMTGYGTIPQAVEAIKAGAAAYLTKPLDPDELLVQVRKALEDKRLRQELSSLRGQLREGWHYRHIIGKSPAMRQVFGVIDRAAAVKTTVLISGESGTGKEMVARALHEASPRKGRAVPGAQLRGDPGEPDRVDAVRARAGCVHRGGPAYARVLSGGGRRDAVARRDRRIAAAMQSKLLRVLEDSQVTPVGTTAPQKVDVRIVAATNRDLEEEVAAGEFRQDLFFRLNIVNIKLPPCGERPDDLPLLTRFFLDEICRTNNFEPREIDNSLLEAFAAVRLAGERAGVEEYAGEPGGAERSDDADGGRSAGEVFPGGAACGERGAGGGGGERGEGRGFEFEGLVEADDFEGAGGVPGESDGGGEAVGDFAADVASAIE